METTQPKLRFSEFKGNWETKFFKEIYSFRSTNSLSREKLNYEKGLVKNIHYGDIHSKFNSLFKAGNEIVPFINEDIQLDKIPAENYLKIKDLIIADASEDYDDIGKCIEIIELNEVKVLAGLHTFVARPDLFELSTGFGNYLLKSDYSKIQIKTIAQGTKVLSLSTTRLSDIKVNIPSLPEQTKIANFLSDIDEKINLLKEKKSLLQEYKKGIMHKIFNQDIRFKDDNGNDFEDWKEKSLESVLEKIVDNRGKTPPVKKNGIPLLEVNSIGNKNINYNVVSKFVNNETYNSWFRVYLEKNDVIFSTVGNTAICSFYDDDFKACIAQNLVGLRFKSEYGLFMYYLLTEKNNNQKFKSIEMGAVQPSVKVSQMIKLTFTLPLLKEQTKIANFLSSIDEKIVLVSNQIKDTQEYKKGLLQQMFI
jgi:type I restriction enzyme S subunit